MITLKTSWGIYYQEVATVSDEDEIIRAADRFVLTLLGIMK